MKVSAKYPKHYCNRCGFPIWSSTRVFCSSWCRQLFSKGK